MKKEIAKLWVDALRSGKYDKGTEWLNYKNGYCCLGVLCELAVESNIIGAKESVVDKAALYAGCDTHLPYEVIRWSGMNSDDGLYNYDYNLIADNDSKDKTFSEIADIIEAHVDEL